jgi:hypothetical protein
MVNLAYKLFLDNIVKFSKKRLIMILFSIVGDFYSSILPLFYEFRYEIKKHYIVYDDARSDAIKAKKIQKGTKSFIKKYALDIETEMLQIDEDSKQSIEKIVAIIKKMRTEDKRVLVNVTDGLANIALLLSYELLDKNVEFVTYDRFDNTYNLLTIDKMHFKTISESINIEDHFLLKDIEIISREALENDIIYQQQLIEFFENFHADRYEFTSHVKSISRQIKSKQTGFLFEEFIYMLLKDLNHDDIAIGIKITDKYSEYSEIINEFDILIMKENHLHMIECKFLEVEKKSELIYKVDSVRTTLDDDSKIMILSNDDLYDPQKTLLLPNQVSPYKRANAKRIYLRGSILNNVDAFIKEVDKIFDLQTKDINEIIKKRLRPKIAYDSQLDFYKAEIRKYLSKELSLKTDFFDKTTLLNLLNAKNHYPQETNLHIKMQEPFIREVVKSLNKLNDYNNIQNIKAIYRKIENF